MANFFLTDRHDQFHKKDGMRVTQSFLTGKRMMPSAQQLNNSLF